uniref:Uncharacterized protein n=1 Tax=Rhizophagus irregularis (strain DAOM 181602 / DAOM 197198 / MUCL 43194) TaxID=747089 RepID=U9TVZ4_RHIID
MRTSILRYSGEEERQTESSNSDSDSDYDESMEQIHDELTYPSLSPFPFPFVHLLRNFWSNAQSGLVKPTVIVRYMQL